MKLHELPVEMIVMILSFIPLEEVKRLRLVSKILKNATEHTTHYTYYSNFVKPINEQFKTVIKVQTEDWQKLKSRETTIQEGKFEPRYIGKTLENENIFTEESTLGERICKDNYIYYLYPISKNLFFSISRDRKMAFWDKSKIVDPRKGYTQIDLEYPIQHLIHSGSTLIGCSRDGFINADFSKNIMTIKKYTDEPLINKATFSQSSAFALGSYKFVQFFEINENQELKLTKQIDFDEGLDFSLINNKLFTAHENGLAVWDDTFTQSKFISEDKKHIHKLNYGHGFLTMCSFDTSSHNKEILFMDLDKLTFVHSYDIKDTYSWKWTTTSSLEVLFLNEHLVSLAGGSEVSLWDIRETHNRPVIKYDFVNDLEKIGHHSFSSKYLKEMGETKWLSFSQWQLLDATSLLVGQTLDLQKGDTSSWRKAAQNKYTSLVNDYKKTFSSKYIKEMGEAKWLSFFQWRLYAASSLSGQMFDLRKSATTPFWRKDNKVQNAFTSFASDEFGQIYQGTEDGKIFLMT